MESNNAIAALAALAQSTRLQTFRLLVKHEPDGLPAGEIARMLDVPQNTMSAHLGTLSRASLVMSERQSRAIIYRADFDSFRELTTFSSEGLLRRQRGTLRPAHRRLDPMLRSVAIASMTELRPRIHASGGYPVQERADLSLASSRRYRGEWTSVLHSA